MLFIDILGVACLVAGFTATDTAKVSAEHANLALRIFTGFEFADFTDVVHGFLLSRLVVTCEFF